MLFRQIPNSHKKRRAQLLSKRAAKREQAEDSDGERPKTKRVPKPKPSHRTKPPRSTPSAPRLALQSRFVSVPKQYLKKTRFAALSAPLPRPLQDDAAAFPLHLLTNPRASRMCVLSRPPFEHGQSKRQVEENEEAMFAKWLAETRATVDEWVQLGETVNGEAEKEEWVHSPTWFESNLEVWRQLWRVVESSSIVLLLVDARCPAVHCPPSLRDYIRSLKPRREVILILTKADLVDPDALHAWESWLKAWWNDDAPNKEDVQVVAVNSYNTSLMTESARARPRPEMPDSARANLVAALKTAHERLKLDAKWKSRMRPTVHWEELKRVNVAATLKTVKLHMDDSHSEPETDGPPLTIGLVGQPNVGKSSLLNALLGTTRVSTSKTPGKTKHFQTMLWGARREVKIVDCPGLVCPSLVPMELQVMAGILPISKIAPVPSCVHFAARFMPLETIFRIPPPKVEVDEMEAKKTWRGARPEHVQTKLVWTTGAILEGRALDRGYYTAMGARPDTNRAGNGMLRALADGRVLWGFWPPGSAPARHGHGVWLDHESSDHSDHDSHDNAHHGEDHYSENEAVELWGYDSLPEEENGKAEEEDEKEDEEHSEEGEDDEDDDDSFSVENNRTFFAALEDFGDDEQDEDNEDEDEVNDANTKS